MPMTEKKMNVILRARIENRIKELKSGLRDYQGFNEDGSRKIQYISTTFSAGAHSFWRSAADRIEELERLLR